MNKNIKVLYLMNMLPKWRFMDTSEEKIYYDWVGLFVDDRISPKIEITLLPDEMRFLKSTARKLGVEIVYNTWDKK